MTAPTLQRQFRESATVCPLASLADLNAASGVALLVIRLGDQVAPMVRELAVIKSRTPRLPIIVITADRFVSLEWTLREIGINAVISEFTPPPQFTAICRSLIDPPE